tara:strand:- start:3093 stop:4031 length:939 start_codon:yes stop_codon:yes gene_type:complete
MPIIIKKNNSNKLLTFIKDKLDNKELISLPTETVYGLAGIGTSIISARKIYKLKERPLNKKLIFHCSNIDMVKKYFHLNDENLILAETFWPGPLTLILKRKSKKIPIQLTKNNYCAVRIPNNIFSQKVIYNLKKPIVMPSANRFKKLSPINAKMVFDQFIDTNLIIVDDGKCKVGIESTLIKIKNKKLEIIRPGKITITNLLKILPFINIHGSKNQKSFSGTSKKHYSPKKKMYLNQKKAKRETAFINFGKIKKGEFRNLSSSSSLSEAARNLYHFIFLADKNQKFKTISIAPIPKYDIGIAINDRLNRAAK